MHHKYDRKKRVSLEVVISALVGEYESLKQIQKFKSYTDYMKKSIENNKTYAVGS